MPLSWERSNLDTIRKWAEHVVPLRQHWEKRLYWEKKNGSQVQGWTKWVFSPLEMSYTDTGRVTLSKHATQTACSQKGSFRSVHAYQRDVKGDLWFWQVVLCRKTLSLGCGKAVSAREAQSGLTGLHSSPFTLQKGRQVEKWGKSLIFECLQSTCCMEQWAGKRGDSSACLESLTSLTHYCCM